LTPQFLKVGGIGPRRFEGYFKYIKLSRKQGTIVWPWVEERLARYTYLPPYHGEDLQVLKYQIGQKYDAHHDVVGRCRLAQS